MSLVPEPDVLCVDGCGAVATDERLVGMVGDSELVELVCHGCSVSGLGGGIGDAVTGPLAERDRLGAALALAEVLDRDARRLDILRSAEMTGRAYAYRDAAHRLRQALGVLGPDDRVANGR